jgi:hypothetical protein
MCDFLADEVALGQFFSPSTLVFPCQFHSTVAPVHEKTGGGGGLVIFITGLHKKPEGCGASVASAAGPFTTKNFLNCVSWFRIWSSKPLRAVLYLYNPSDVPFSFQQRSFKGTLSVNRTVYCCKCHLCRKALQERIIVKWAVCLWNFLYLARKQWLLNGRQDDTGNEILPCQCPLE